MDKDQTKKSKVSTQVMTGFMELLPAEQIVLDSMLEKIKKIYELFGFVAIDTPVIERSDVLLAKAGGETEKQIYRFTKGDNDIALRFDLTVPLARYVSEHFGDLIFPFRRYHIGKVYRGERPQKGRFREFYQCDIDTIGDGKLSLLNDAEIPSVIYKVFSELNLGDFVIRISNRKLITGLFQDLGLTKDLSVDAMRMIDKLEKIGEEEVEKLLLEIGINKASIEKIINFVKIQGSEKEIVVKLSALNINNELFKTGISELQEVLKNVALLGVPAKNFKADMSIARGLDYYTGTVYETFLNQYPGFGSICSGGRYDNLAESYINKNLPGVGMSIGLTRLFSQMKEVGLVKFDKTTNTKVLVIPMVDDMAKPLEVATFLRSNGISTEVFLDAVKIKNVMKYADRLGVPFVVIIGEDEIKTGKITIKDMKSGEQKTVVQDGLIAEMKSI